MILPPLRAYLIPFAVLLAAGSSASGADPATRVTVTMTCKDVHALVVLVGGWDALVRVATDGGATKRQIAEVLKCR